MPILREILFQTASKYFFSLLNITSAKLIIYLGVLLTESTRRRDFVFFQFAQGKQGILLILFFNI